MKKLGNNLADLCKKRGFSLSSLSTRAGIPKTTIHSWTQGTSPNLEQLKKVCVVLEISLHELVFGEPDPFHISKSEILKEIFSGDIRVTLHKIERSKT